MKTPKTFIALSLALLIGTTFGCNKEKAAIKNITGHWKTTSYVENGIERFNNWYEVNRPLSCNGVMCTYKNKLVIYDWEIREEGSLFFNNSNDIIEFNPTKCTCEYYPEKRASFSDYLFWDVSEDGKTFTLSPKTSGTDVHFEIVKLTKQKWN